VSGSSELPTSIGRYRIRTRLAGDEIDEVYTGFDPMIERPVALRVFRLRLPDNAAQARVTAIFYQEMQRIGVLIHPNIVTLYDAGEFPGALFIASELIEGDLLAEHLGSPAVDAPIRMSMLVQIVEALEYGRGAGVSHLNLKPTSVRISPDYTLKIAGFGVATVLDALAAETGTRPPVSRYLAPERAAGEPGDARSDVYALAQIALDVLGADTTTPPAADRVPPIPPILADRQIDPARWTSVFARALAVNPADRYDSALTLKFELVLLLGIDESDAQMSWETARAMGQLGSPAAPPDDADMATMMADARMRMARPPGDYVPVHLDPDTGTTGAPHASETMMAPSGDHIVSPFAGDDMIAHEGETMLTPQPFKRTAPPPARGISSSEEETHPAGAGVPPNPPPKPKPKE
jgi:serine/threonine-protein kinase